MHQQLWGYKAEEKMYLGGTRTKEVEEGKRVPSIYESFAACVDVSLILSFMSFSELQRATFHTKCQMTSQFYRHEMEV